MCQGGPCGLLDSSAVAASSPLSGTSLVRKRHPHHCAREHGSSGALGDRYCKQISPQGLLITNIYFLQIWRLEDREQGASTAEWSRLRTVSSPRGRGQGAVWELFQEGTTPFTRAPPSWLKHLPLAPPPNDIPLGVRISHANFSGATQRHIYEESPGFRRASNIAISSSTQH